MPFLMEIEDPWQVKKDGDIMVVVSGKVREGNIAVGDTVEVVGFSQTVQQAVVVEKDFKPYAEGLLQGTLVLQGVSKSDVTRGQVVATSGRIQAWTRCRAHIVFSAEKERIDPQPFFDIFRSLLHIRRTDVFTTIFLPEGVTELAPGDELDVRMEFPKPIALEVGLSFFIGRFMGTGTVTGLIE